MSIFLIFPPAWDISMPYLSVPALAGFLKARGVPVISCDANIASFHYLMRPEQLLNALNHIKYKKEWIDRRHEAIAIKAMTIGEYIVQNIGKAISYFSEKKNLKDYSELLWADSIIENAFEIYTARFYPVHFFVYGTTYSAGLYNPQDMLKFADDLNCHLKGFGEDHILPQIYQTRPLLIGFSVICREQLLHSIYLACQIRKAMPDIHITLGGCFFNIIREKLDRDYYPLGKFFDSIIFGQGELPLYGLYEYLTNGKGQCSKLKNILFFNEEKTLLLEDDSSFYKDYPAPDFTDYSLNDYMANDIMLPYQFASGCYYGKCTFCNSKTATTEGYVCKEASKAYMELKMLKTKYKCSIFHINDEALNVNLISKIASRMEKLNLTIFTQARFESSLDLEKLRLIKKAGIKNIAFGFESANVRILRLMNKGYDIQSARRILEDCHKAGIEVHLFGIIGFPGETEEERQESLDFVKSLSAYKKSILFGYYFHTFLLEYGSMIYREYRRFGIERILDEEKFNFYADYVIDGKRVNSSTYLKKRDMFHKDLYENKPCARIFPFFSSIIYLSMFSSEEMENIVSNDQVPLQKRFLLKTLPGRKKLLYDLQGKKLFALDSEMFKILSYAIKISDFDIKSISEMTGYPKLFIREKFQRYGLGSLLKQEDLEKKQKVE